MIEKEKEFFQLHSNITEAKISFQQRLGRLVSGTSHRDAQERLNSGKHVLDFEQLQLPEEKLRQLLGDFSSALRRTEFHEAFDVEELNSAVEAGEIRIHSLITEVFRGNSDFVTAIGEKLAVSPDLLVYLATNLVNAFLELYVAPLREGLDLSGWLDGHCPLCGSEAAFARLRRDDGKRILWCQFCSTEWEYPRIRCPFCSTENHRSLKYLFTEKDDRYHVYLCDECKRYVKAIDQRAIPEEEKLDLFLENAKTPHLDILARRDGYRGRYWLEQVRV